jgi:hypothetical protein
MGVLVNDSDPDGDPLQAALVTTVSQGMLTFNLDGSFFYQPLAGFSGMDSFTYRAGDGVLTSDIATVRLAVRATEPEPPSTNGIIAGEVYDDGTGLLLSDATVEFLDLDGQIFTAAMTTSSDIMGRFHLVSQPGVARLRISKDGYTSVERIVSVVGGKITNPFDARLTALSAGVNLSSLLGGSVTDTKQFATLTVPALALADDRAISLTSVSGQGLAALLPLGWSPVAAVEISPVGIHFESAATLAVSVTTALPNSAVVVAASWKEGRWMALDPVALADDSATLSIDLMESGQVVFLLADIAPGGPALPLAGEEVFGAEPQDLPSNFMATFSPSSQILFVRTETSTEAAIQIAAEGSLQSGMPIAIEFTEAYDFLGNSHLYPAPMTQDFSLYAYPAGARTLQSALAVSASRPIDPYQLELGRINLAAQWPVTVGAPYGVVLSTNGGQVDAIGGATVRIAAGAAMTDLPVSFQVVGSHAIDIALPDTLLPLGQVLLDLYGARLNYPAILSIPAPLGTGDSDQVLVAELVEANGISQIRLVALASLQDGNLVTQTDLLGDDSLLLPGVLNGGRYLFLRSTVALGYVTGEVHDTTNQSLANALISVDGFPLVAWSGADGSYLLAAPVGTVTVRAVNLTSQDELSQSGSLAEKHEVITIDLSLLPTPPRIIAANPTHGASSVPLTSTVSVIFSEPVSNC